MRAFHPLARNKGLVVREVHDELVVYDLERHQASCLNRVAALVWRRADGRTSVTEIARDLRAQTHAPLDESAVWLALARLSEARLIEGELPGAGDGVLSRREWIRTLTRAGVSAALLPAVASIVAPTPAEAASVIQPNECMSLPPSACSGQPCTNNKRCYYDASQGRCRCL